MSSRRSLSVLGVVAAAAAWAACVGDSSAPPVDGGVDATTDVVSGADATNDGPVDAAIDHEEGDADAGPTATYSALNDSTKWAFYDQPANRYDMGGVFAGSAVYFVSTPGQGAGLVSQYSTAALQFDAGLAWQDFSTMTLDAGAYGFNGSVFDGRYVYLVPGSNTAPDGVVTRYDTQAVFANAASWSTFDTTTVNASAKGFGDATFDGQYIYFVTGAGLVTRYNRLGTFTSSGSWSTFDMTTVNAGASAFFGAVFDGRYAYFIPAYSGSGSGIVMRYDTQATFTATGSWTAFDLTTVNSVFKFGFKGGAFDGRYVYFTPFAASGVASGLTTRYDTQASFTTSGSWTTFDMTTVNTTCKGFWGAAFDGRYVYFVPDTNGVGGDGNITRYDTQAPFTTVASWTVFDMTTLTTNAAGYSGAVFDGRYLYLVPNSNNNIGTVARFDAKTPASLPAGYAHGSFL